MIEIGSSARLPDDTTKVAILVNPRAGSGSSLRLVRELEQALRAHRLHPTICWERESLSELMAATSREEWRCVVAAGGDGTLLEVVNRAQGAPVSLLPLGNENLVAKYCGLRKSGKQLAQTIVEGRIFQTDLASANGRLFSVMAGVGLDAEVVHRVHARRRGHINKLHYVVPTFQALSYYGYPKLTVEIPETGEELSGSLCFVFNIPQYALNFPIALGALPNDGLLDLYLFERPGMWSLGRYLWKVIRKRHTGLSDCYHRTVKRAVIRSDVAAPVQTDGDPAGAVPLTVEVLPGALTLVVPPAS